MLSIKYHHEALLMEFHLSYKIFQFQQWDTP